MAVRVCVGGALGFTGDVVDALLRSGGDAMLTEGEVTRLAEGGGSAVARAIAETDLPGIVSLKHRCRRAIRVQLGQSGVMTKLLCGSAEIQHDLRKFLFYDADLTVARSS